MITEMIHDQPDNTTKSVPCAEDFTAAGTLTELNVLWYILWS